MWTKVLDFYKSNKHVILWTAGYFIATWAIMKYMFDFNIFSSLRWHQLTHAHLRGFAGMVFGILILAAVPMYIATSIVIARTKAPLFSVKIPERIKTFFVNAFTQTPMDEPAPVPTPTPEPEQAGVIEPAPDSEPVPTEKPIPETIPSEMRIAYARAREHTSRVQTSAFDLSNITKAMQSKTQNAEPIDTSENQEMPIPTDFDIEDVDDMIDSVPTFTDISFDDDNDDETPIEINDIHVQSDNTKPITEFLDTQSVPYKIADDVVTTDKYAIAAHTDQDFWVADDENWFAAGKTRKSPIELVKRIAAEHDIQPVLYLAADNIMDIDELRKQWESDGIRIITDLKDLI